MRRWAEQVRLTASASDDALSRCMPRPLALSLAGLGLAVVLWGLGYKLSLYRPHPTPSTRAGVAKLWAGPRKTAKAGIRGANLSKKPMAPGSWLSWLASPERLTPGLASAGLANAGLVSSGCWVSPAPRHGVTDSRIALAIHIRLHSSLSTLRSPPALRS
jgi:hypothetical protein